MRAATKDNEKSIVLGVRFSEEELEAIRARADAEGRKTSAWVRWIALRALKAQTSKKKKGARK
jgi:predicted DNA binding CopG/RHH family protein